VTDPLGIYRAQVALGKMYVSHEKKNPALMILLFVKNDKYLFFGGRWLKQ